MTGTLTLAGEEHLADFATLLSRSEKAGAAQARLAQSGRALAVYVPVFAPSGLLDPSPLVLGLRVFELADPTEPKIFAGSTEVDGVFAVRALLDRIAHVQKAPSGSSRDIPLPPPEVGIVWSAITPPRAGWEVAGELAQSALVDIAKSGITHMTEVSGLGAQIVDKARAETWFSAHITQQGVKLPKAVAFAQYALGFLNEDDPSPATVFRASAWTRITTSRGHVLVK